jgi:hypothetical protein
MTDKLKDFLKSPVIKRAYEKGGLAEVGRMLCSVGNLSKDQEFRTCGGKVLAKAKQKASE